MKKKLIINQIWHILINNHTYDSMYWRISAMVWVWFNLAIILDPSPRRIWIFVVGWLSSTVGAAPAFELELPGKAPGVGLGAVYAAGLPRRLPVPSKGFGGALGGGV